MRTFTIITLMALALFACKKDDVSTPTATPNNNNPDTIPEVNPGITADTYRELKTQLIFEEDFSSIDEWIIDTTVRKISGGYFSKYDKVNRCFTNDGFLHLTAYLDSRKTDSLLGYQYNLEHTAQITRNIGDLIDAERYLVEIKVQYFDPLHSYFSSIGARGDVTRRNGGSSISLTINGMEYNLFGLRESEEYSTPFRTSSVISKCFNELENETFSLILDGSNHVNKALIGNEIKLSCSNQSEYFSEENIINIKTNPWTSRGSDITPQSVAGECIIDYIKIYAVLE